MRKNFGAKPWSYPQPVFIIAAYDDCKAILEKDGDKLQQVVAYLMEHETMTGAQFADLMEGRELSEASATALTDGYGEEESE